MLSILVEMVPSYFAGYYSVQYQEGKIGLRKFFWLMFFIFLISTLLFALFYDYQYMLDHWLRFLIMVPSGSFAIASLLTALLWFISKKIRKASPETSDSGIGNNVG